ncbi:MAG: GntR family transcriptional regulator [Clostridiales bacterium]|nr:GntR family transcriptional regulator [Clostridiales bacterium]MDY5976547.1 GntR family transcriptional regulator [Anaerovoracaceae bacterium]
MINFDIQNHRPLREIVYEELKAQILKGDIKPGTRMMEVELAEVLGVSRTPVREAIRKLEKEGLVKIEPRRGAYASELSVKDMVDILEVRQSMEGLAAYYCAQRINDEQKEQLRDYALAFNEAVEEGVYEDMISYDTKFHHLIVECCDNDILVHMVEQLQELVLRFRYLYYSDFKRAEQMPAEHHEIFEAVASGDAERAREAAALHINRLKDMVETEGV